MNESQIVYIVERIADNDDNRIIWKVYNTEEKAKKYCDGFNEEEYFQTRGYRFTYDKWQVR